MSKELLFEKKFDYFKTLTIFEIEAHLEDSNNQNWEHTRALEVAKNIIEGALDTHIYKEKEDDDIVNFGEPQCYSLKFFLERDLWRLTGTKENRDYIKQLVENAFNEASELDNEKVNEVIFKFYEDDDILVQNDAEPDSHQISKRELAQLWKPNKIKIFISHRDTHKKEVAELATHLAKWGMDCFVAHEDIETPKEWPKVIEQKLCSMDFLVAYITDDFWESEWTNQEIGFAQANGITMIPVKIGSEDPKGFLKDIQAATCRGMDSSGVGEKILKALKTSNIRLYKRVVIKRFGESDSFDTADILMDLIFGVAEFTESEIDRLVSAHNGNSQVYGTIRVKNEFLLFINKKSGRDFIKDPSNESRIIEKPAPVAENDGMMDDEIPF